MAFPFFHGLLDVTFRFFEENYGREGLRRYLRWLAENYYAELIDAARRDGLDALEKYWRDVADDEMAAEAQAHMDVERDGERLFIEVKRCPAFVWMEENGRQACECYCEQCAVMNAAIADAAGIEFELRGGQGQCVQVFRAGGDGR